MISALVLTDDSLDCPTLASDLSEAGIPVRGACACDTLVRQAVQSSPDVVVGWSERPGPPLFEALATLAQVNPCPVVLFTGHGDIESIERAIAAGVHAYEIGGYAPSRLRSVIHVAQARFRANRALRAELDELKSRYEERRLVDRAKGILMRSGAVTEEEAFRTLRSASQRGNRRVGEVAGRLIEAARAAEAVNRGGQLRMLSQRIVKLQALRVARVDAAGASTLLAQSRARALANLEVVENLVSRSTHGDLLGNIRASWRSVEVALDSAAAPSGLAELDSRAEQLSAGADRLVTALGGGDPGSGLHAVNICGRQRMLSQRLAKLALLGGLLEAPHDASARRQAEATALEFERAMAFLGAASPGIDGVQPQLDEAAQAWSRMRAAVSQAGGHAGRLELAASSEAVLESFEQLTGRLERSLSVLLGQPAGTHFNPLSRGAGEGRLAQ